MKLNKVLCMALIVGFTAPAFAGPVGISRAPVTTEKTEVIAELASAKGEHEHDALLATKGYAAALHRMKVVEVGNLIERLERGEQVSQDEIDQVMKR